MKEIPLTQGKVALVDDADYLRLSQFKWCAIKKRNTFYAIRTATIAPKKEKRVYLHREVLGVSVRVDHQDGNGLNNRRGNLRVATSLQNMQNRRKITPKSSAYKGVSLSRGKWRSRITIAGTLTTLGSFLSEQDAALAYNEAAKKNFAEFANLNLIP